MGKFKELYITEIKKNTLIKNTNPERKKKGRKNVLTKPPKVTELDNGLTRYEYNFKSDPSTEGKRHWGYIDVDETTGDIKKIWCDCKDWSFRLYSPFEKKGLSTWELPKKYEKRMPIDHNQQWTKETNPNGKLYVCKHVYSLLKFYMD